MTFFDEIRKKLLTYIDNYGILQKEHMFDSGQRHWMVPIGKEQNLTWIIGTRCRTKEGGSMAKRVTEAHPDYIKRLLELSEESEAETNQAQMQRLKRALRDVIKNDLTPRQKEMVVLYYYEGMRMPQIAQQLNRDVSTVSRTIKRARRNLRDRLKYLI
ncbi:sigma-70 family RNA polymerase sigma factor [Ruminococcus champanellensis]